MVKILLADDNKMALDYFSHLVEWEKHGFELVATAIDGESALIEFNRTHPDVVITDVQMPNMTGIQLAEKIRMIAPETIVIFLSSYEEFEYVRAGLDLGIFDYILKHETKEKELVEKLTKVKESLEKKQRERHYIAEGDLSYFLNNIKNKSDRKSGELLEAFPSRYHMFAVYQDHVFTPLAQIFGGTTAPFEENSFKDVIYGFDDIISAVKFDSYIHIVLSRSERKPIDMYYEVKNAFEAEFGDNFSILSIEENSDILSCLERFETYSKLFRQKIFYPKSIVLYRNAIKQVDEEHILILSADYIVSAIENNQSDKLCKELDSIFFKVLQNKSYIALEKVTKECADALMRFHRDQIDVKAKVIFNVCDERSVKYWYEAETIFEWFREKFRRLQNILSDSYVNSYSRNVKKSIFVCVPELRKHRSERRTDSC